MKLIAGLGNPGRKYKDTRHNVGFLVIEEVARRNGWGLNKKKFQGHYAIEHLGMEQIILLEPQTYMNLSGESIKPLMDFYSIEPEDVCVIYDDLDLPTGKVRMRQNGGHGGHNGMRSIIDQLGTKNFNRVRVGIDRPKPGMTVTDHVLGKFSKEEKVEMSQAITLAADACEAWFKHTFQEVMNQHN
ncbi:peptidyl-tRNA hydrolase [Streptohalobacillus salinus]|uniref:Peptidyl-tRNA hydrolase n=1 Tax=Streptohalobacillus salinus TaxID=621096 RepID=A0A2V3W5S3_9BACI|nr:aminoacyl-tRNA hydrolase [Streptohalobacillus salinus]PXW88468.1 peptidyl-tRNA hydrolase [Streptohalobacillus salinus]